MREAKRIKRERQKETDKYGAKARRKRQAREAVRRCRERKLTEMQKDPDHELHGTPTGWSYGCRCELCCQVRSSQNAARRATYKKTGMSPAGRYPADHPWRDSDRKVEE